MTRPAPSPSAAADRKIAETLAAAVDRYGRDWCLDERRCEGMLKDLLPGHLREVKLLMDAVEAGAVRDLAGNGAHLPVGIRMRRLVRRLHDDMGLREDLAERAIGIWAVALGVAEPGDAVQRPRAGGRWVTLVAGVCVVLGIGGLVVRDATSWLTRAPAVAPVASASRLQPDNVPEPTGPAAPLQSQAGQIVRNSLGMELARIPAGRFVMGSPEGEMPQDDPQSRFRTRGSDEPQVDVTISHPFLMGVREVTETQWETVMGDQPWNHPPPYPADEPVAAIATPRRAEAIMAVTLPAEPASGWQAAREFCSRLTNRERATGVISADEEYRLPTEAEWEYACRAGSTGPYWFGDDVTDWERQSRLANPWGLRGMHLDPWEWCDDEFRAVDDEAGSFPPLRGGEGIRAAGRSVCVRCEGEAGFRVVVARRPGVAGTVAGEERRDNGLSMPLVWVPPGAFRMRTCDLVFGDDAPAAPDQPDGAWTDVSVGRGFWIGKFEVTLAEWLAVMEPGETAACSAVNAAGDVAITVRLPKALDFERQAVPEGDPLEVSIDVGPRAFVQGAPLQELEYVGFTDVFDRSRVPPAPPLVSGTMQLDPLTSTTTSWTNDNGLEWLTYPGRSIWKGRLGADGRYLFGIVTVFVSGSNASRSVALPVAAGRVSANGRARHPVFNATYHDSRAFCRRLTARERQAGRLSADWEYRLPTEVEWERAARAGAKTRHAFGNEWDAGQGAVRARFGWFSKAGTMDVLPQAVGLKAGNAWRIHDAYGNVPEWCLRSVAAIEAEYHPPDAAGWLRGGSWNDGSPTVASRPDGLGGLRVVLAPFSLD